MSISEGAIYEAGEETVEEGEAEASTREGGKERRGKREEE